MRLDSRLLVALTFSVFGVFGCSLINAPDDINPGAGGAGAEGGGGTGAIAGGGEGGDPQECDDDDDCDSLDSDCADGACNGGECEVEPKAVGAPCGDDGSTTCDEPDGCDGAGECGNNNLPPFLCDGCPAGPGQCGYCDAGECPDCTTFATFNNLRQPDPLAGWTLTGDWGIYTESGFSLEQDSAKFGKPVLGTNGNNVTPNPGSENESSSATSPPMVIPEVLNFRSWHQDEIGQPGNFNYDNHRVSVSVDGNNFIPIMDCLGGINAVAPACSVVPFIRPADQWDDMGLSIIGIAPAVVGQVGVIRFEYVTGDASVGFERGWFVDNFNVDMQCACVDDDQCGHLTGDCGTGRCDSATGTCQVTAMPAGTPCGSATEDSCNLADTCGPRGICEPNVKMVTGLCDDCPGGPANCGCTGTMCTNCAPAPVNNFNYADYASTWAFTGDWRFYQGAPPTGSDPTPRPFLNMALGVDGIMTMPYPMIAIEDSTAISPRDILPAVLTFTSRHQDEGGQGGFDNKTIRFSTDMVAWTTLVDCEMGPMSGVPFCQSVTGPELQFANINIPTGALAGSSGHLEFGYHSVDVGSVNPSGERGWYIDDLNFARPCAFP